MSGSKEEGGQGGQDGQRFLHPPLRDNVYLQGFAHLPPVAQKPWKLHKNLSGGGHLPPDPKDKESEGDGEQSVQVVQCNYKSDTSACRAGSRAYLSYKIDVAGHRVQVVARSRSGRWVVRWESLMDLHCFRIRCLVERDGLFLKSLPIARNHWNQDVVVNLNRIAGKVINGN